MSQVRDIAGHKFVTTSYSQPTFCAVCKNLIWGVMKQGWSCLGACVVLVAAFTPPRLWHEYPQGQRRTRRAHVLREGGGLQQGAVEGEWRLANARRSRTQSNNKTSFFKRKVSSKDKVVKDKEEAERVAESLVDPAGKEDTPAEEEWMNQYTHPSRKAKTTDASTEEETSAVSTLASSDTADATTGAVSTTPATGGDATVLKTGEKSSAAAAAAASAWGASVLASADGW